MRLAELALGTARAEKQDLVGAAVVGIDQMALPTACASAEATAFRADECAEHVGRVSLAPINRASALAGHGSRDRVEAWFGDMQTPRERVREAMFPHVKRGVVDLGARGHSTQACTPVRGHRSTLHVRELCLESAVDRGSFDEHGLSQRELADDGVSYAYISRLEADTRTPSIKALRTLAPKLGVSVHWLETGEPDPAEELARLVLKHRGTPLPAHARALARAILKPDDTNARRPRKGI